MCHTNVAWAFIQVALKGFKHTTKENGKYILNHAYAKLPEKEVQK